MTKVESIAYEPALMRARLLSAAAGASPLAVFAVDAAGNVVFAEGGGIPTLTGGSVELDGLPLLDAWGETPALVAAIAGALSGTRFTGGIAAGQRRFEVRVVPLHDATTGICGAAGIAVPADPPPADDSNSDAARILEALVNSIPLAVWILDHRGDVVRENALARECGRDVIRTAQEHDSVGMSLAGRVLLQGLETRGTAPVRGSKGSPVDVPVRGVPLRGERGKTVGAIVLASPPEPQPAPPSIPDSFLLSPPLEIHSVEMPLPA